MTALVLAELKQRMRGKRWWILLALWTLVLWLLVAFVRWVAVRSMAFDPVGSVPIGPAMFGALVLFVLGLACLVVPALTATSINGERDRGTLAPLQATLLTPVEILGAKFAASLATAAAFVAATLPLAAWAFTEGGLGAWRVVVVYAALLLSCALFCALGLAASALVRKPTLSVVAAYAAVFLLTAGSPILFGLSLAAAPERAVRSPDGYVYYGRAVGWRWLILAPNPFVVVADAAPRSASGIDPLEWIRLGARTVRSGRPFDDTGGQAVWPAGLAIDAALALGAAATTARRLRVPRRRLVPGERVA